jgi:hypothetical protein
MSAKKMLVVYLASTNAVLGVATLRAAGAPPVGDLVGTALPVRTPGKESGVAVAAENLGVKEVEYSDDVVRQPLAHGLDSSGSVVPITGTITAASSTSLSVSISLSAVAIADKSALVIVDAGATRDPLKFTAKTTASNSVSVPVTGVPPGLHDVFVSVDGFAPTVASGSF